MRVFCSAHVLHIPLNVIGVKCYLFIMSLLPFVTQECVWIACEGAGRSTSGGWTQKTTHTWA